MTRRGLDEMQDIENEIAYLKSALSRRRGDSRPLPPSVTRAYRIALGRCYERLASARRSSEGDDIAQMEA